MTNTEINSRSDNNLGQNCNERLSIVIHIIQQLISSTSENCPKIVANLNGVNFTTIKVESMLLVFVFVFWYFLHYTHAHFSLLSFLFTARNNNPKDQTERKGRRS